MISILSLSCHMVGLYGMHTYGIPLVTSYISITDYLSYPDMNEHISTHINP